MMESYVLLPGRTRHTSEITVVHKAQREAVMFAHLIVWPESRICLERSSGAEMSLSVLDIGLMLWVFTGRAVLFSMRKRGSWWRLPQLRESVRREELSLVTQKQQSKENRESEEEAIF